MIVRSCILTLVSVLLNAQEPARNVAIPKDKEAALGAMIAGESRKRTTSLGDSTVQDYIERLGKQLATQVIGRDGDWEFAVIRDDVGGSTHEALSIPGGYIFVPASLILAVENEGELAGMLAHSMAHVAERHGAGMGLTTNDDRAPIPAGYLTIQRRNELDADRAAVKIVAAAGYDPTALLEYVRRTQRALTAESGRYSVLPPREERISALETAVANLLSGASQPSGEFNAIQDRVRELAVPSTARPPSPLKQPPSLRRKGEQ